MSNSEDAVEMDFSHLDGAINFSKLDADPERGLVSYAPWTWGGVSALVRRLRLRWTRYCDDDMQQFILSWPGIEDKMDEDAKWEFKNVLGRGGYGMVGHWQQIDSSNHVIDDIAIKQNPAIKNKAMKTQFWQPANDRLPIEAVCSIEMNPLSDNVPNLRRLKVYESARRLKDVWRLYFEYCRHGDIRNLIKRYVGWKHVAYNTPETVWFPEEFLWHLFHQFALVNAAAARGPFRDSQTGAVDQLRFYLHSDIKPDNIMLTDPDPDAIFPTYPTVKVGDWGLGVSTTISDPQNPHRYFDRGTKVWYAPEQASNYPTDRRRLVIADREPEPLWTGIDVLNNSRGARHKLTPSMNTWAFAAIIYCMMTLDLNNTMLTIAMRGLLRNSRNVAATNYNMIPPITASRPVEYSRELRNLVGECLNVAPPRRPGHSELLSRTEGACLRIKESLDGAGLQPQPVVLEGNTRPSQAW